MRLAIARVFVPLKLVDARNQIFFFFREPAYSHVTAPIPSHLLEGVQVMCHQKTNKQTSKNTQKTKNPKTQKPFLATGYGVWKLVAGVKEVLTFSVDKKPFYHFSFLSSLNFMTLLITLICDSDLPCTSCLNNPLIVFFFVLIGISFGKGDVL